MSKTRYIPGFTLVELMIALVIASLLASIAYPSYRDHLIRAAIPQATSGLSAYAMRLEEYYLDHRTYRNSAGQCAADGPGSEKFNFSCKTDSRGQSYLLTATGAAGDLASFTFTLDQNGNERTTALPESWGKSPLNCWIQKRSASC